MIKIRTLSPQDFPAWLPLWDGNNGGVRDADVTAQTWARLVAPDFPVHGIVAEDKNGALVGLVHYVLHPTTGSLSDICYMQDVYVDPAHRRNGIARKLVESLAQTAKAEKWSRMYWLAEANNESAQHLYKTIGVKLDFTLHVLLTA